jgi:methylthioribose-1-phosphate isomerase
MFLISAFPVYIASDKIIIFSLYKKSVFPPQMKVKDQHFETIWIHPADPYVVQIIDQRYLPFRFVVEDLRTMEDVFRAIRDMHLRGAPLIGVAGALGMYLALTGRDAMAGPDDLKRIATMLKGARPTAVNLAWALDRMADALTDAGNHEEQIRLARETALNILAMERENSRLIGTYGLQLIAGMHGEHHEPVQILTHCNAGWLACIDYGTALAPVYMAHDSGIPVHVWVDETRPRNQGARLTAWELKQHGIPCTVITDNAGGYLMMRRMVDMVIVGSDRASVYGDVVNKVGTYLKALAAHDNGIPFYAALPSSTIDPVLGEGAMDTVIEERDGREVRNAEGWMNGQIGEVNLIPEDTQVSNYGFDISPARLVTAFITERGIVQANKTDILNLFPEKNLNPGV